MNETHLLRFVKETDNKLRWDAYVDNARFSFYIPKWRVPEPWPMTIFVQVSGQVYKYKYYTPITPQIVREDPQRVDSPIQAVVTWVSDHTETARYAPQGDPKRWEIGEPYIPYSILPGGSCRSLLVKVGWNP